MRTTKRRRGAWLFLGVCFTLIFLLGGGVAEAKKKSSDKCQGTKMQRKQKMDKRDITNEQFQEMVERYRQDLSTNLDIARGRIFNLGREAQRAMEEGTSHRMTSILLASSALPAAFPPLEIDGMLYAEPDCPESPRWTIH